MQGCPFLVFEADYEDFALPEVRVSLGAKPSLRHNIQRAAP
jgi:hypothetical protein